MQLASSHVSTFAALTLQSWQTNVVARRIRKAAEVFCIR